MSSATPSDPAEPQWSILQSMFVYRFLHLFSRKPQVLPVFDKTCKVKTFISVQGYYRD